MALASSAARHAAAFGFIRFRNAAESARVSVSSRHSARRVERWETFARISSMALSIAYRLAFLDRFWSRFVMRQRSVMFAVVDFDRRSC